MKSIDHLVYCVPNLKKGIAEIEKRFGTKLSPGGKHLTQGTKNVLLNLGNGCYFELLAIDSDNSEIVSPRWMGIDLIQKPQLTRWALKSEDFEKDLSILQKANPLLAKAYIGSRKTADGSFLNWKMSLPQPQPEIEILPFLLDWQDSVHPTESMPQNCKLVELSATHPDPSSFKKTFELLDFDLKITASAIISLSAKIETPKGVITI